MQRRPSARLLILDNDRRLLLFRFTFKSGALAGQDYWATPGGGLDLGETFEAAAIREMKEETGIVIHDVGRHVAERECVVPMPDGESVISEERYYVINVEDPVVSRAGWTAHELDVMAEHRWWPVDELTRTEATVWPKNLPEILRHASRVPTFPPLKIVG